jgi:hypothetical protein
MIKEDGYELLKTIVDKDTTHVDYKRVTDLADLYYKMVTGDKIESLLQRIETRVTPEEFDQIKRIYRSIIPSTINSTKLPFKKVTRKKPLTRKIEFPEESENKKTELEKYINTYWGDKSLDKYMEYAFVDYNYLDPNAFLITEFDDFDPKTEKAKPYPFIASSKEVIDFRYKNEILQYVVVRLPITYMDNGIERDGYKFTIYLGNDTIVFTQVASKGMDEEVLELAKKFYSVQYFEPKNEKVPAIRFGYKKDPVTKGRTLTSCFHEVVPFLEKTLKIDSELDLSTSLTAFPQRFMYATPCKNPGCRKGFLIDNTECPHCGGTGHEPIHAGTQDVIVLSLPNDPSTAFDLEKMLVYKSPPIELLTFQKDYLEYLKKSVHAMMFNADLYTREQVSITATEKLLETDNLNDTLYDFAQHYSSVWEYVVKDISTYIDLPDLTVDHQFPENFKFKGLVELMSELKMAKEANASTSTIAAIEDDINEILYSDRPDELKVMRIKNSINPFRGYSDSNIKYILSSGNTTEFNVILWTNMESIFQDLEAENPEIYEMSMDVIRKEVAKKVAVYMELIGKQKQAEFEQYVQQ